MTRRIRGRGDFRRGGDRGEKTQAMIWGHLVRGPRHLPLVWLLLALFVVGGTIHYASRDGGDLAPSYAACRLMASGQGGHIYSYDPADFTALGNDSAWIAAARSAGVTGSLHPYVQTPLWAAMLEPLCTRTNFLGFDRVFAFLALASFAGIIFLVARYWAPELLNPYAVAAILLLLFLTTPFKFAMLLMQTHVLFFLMVIGALLLAEKQRPLAAGLLLACAAAVKITPGFLIVYWLLGRRWRAASSAAVWSAALWGLTLAVCGRALVNAYLANLNRISATLLVSHINQSFAAWWMSWTASLAEQETMHSLTLPTGIKLLSTGLTLICLVAGGGIDRRRAGRVPLGAMMALVGAMIFAPIAWAHYYVILLAPLMLLVHEYRRLRSVWIAAGVAFVILLNVHLPAAMERHLPVRTIFYSGVMCLLLLAYVAWRGRTDEWNGGMLTVCSSGLQGGTASSATLKR